MTAQFRLVMRSGPTPGATYELAAEEMTIGRDLTNAIVINDAEVSRHHVRLTAKGGMYVLEDLGSTNGTSVNGQRILSPHVLKPGEVISLGEQIVLVFEAVMRDPNATVVSTRPPAVVRPTAVATPPSPPRQAYAGRVPPGPAAPAPTKPARRRSLPLIIVSVVVLFLICACVGILLYIDANYLWCMVLPFLSGCG